MTDHIIVDERSSICGRCQICRNRGVPGSWSRSVERGEGGSVRGCGRAPALRMDLISEPTRWRGFVFYATECEAGCCNTDGANRTQLDKIRSVGDQEPQCVYKRTSSLSMRKERERELTVETCSILMGRGEQYQAP